MEGCDVTHVLYTQRSVNSSPHVTFYVKDRKNKKSFTSEKDWYDFPKDEFRKWFFEIGDKDFDAALELAEWYYCYSYRKTDKEKELFFKHYGCKDVNLDE